MDDYRQFYRIFIAGENRGTYLIIKVKVNYVVISRDA